MVVYGQTFWAGGYFSFKFSEAYIRVLYLLVCCLYSLKWRASEHTREIGGGVCYCITVACPFFSWPQKRERKERVLLFLYEVLTKFPLASLGGRGGEIFIS